MNRQCLVRGLLVLYLLLPLAAWAETPFSSIFVFGDSLSDTGNLASLPKFGFLHNPPFNNGFSNGDFAVQVLANDLGLELEPSLHLLGAAVGTNYAIAGAKAGGNTPVDLKAQIAAFLLNNGGVAPADALYVVFIGGNDVRDARDDPGDEAVSMIKRAVGGISFAIQALAKTGAKAILVVNAPDLGLIPEIRKLGGPSAIRATRLSTQFNALLAKQVLQLERELSLDIVDFSLFSFSRFIANNNLALGFTNDTAGCFFIPSCVSGDNFDKFVFFDNIHPTGRVQERIGRALFAVVPELDTSPPGALTTKNGGRSIRAGYVHSMAEETRNNALDRSFLREIRSTSASQ